MQETIKKHKWDIIVISAILLIATVSLSLCLIFRREGASVEITIGGVSIGEYPLYENATYELYGVIPTEDKGYDTAPNNPVDKITVTHLLVIKDGVAYMEHATCKGQQCVKKGTIKYVGQHIICAYHDVRVSVKGKTEGGVDLVS